VARFGFGFGRPRFEVGNVTQAATAVPPSTPSEQVASDQQDTSAAEWQDPFEPDNNRLIALAKEAVEKTRQHLVTGELAEARELYAYVYLIADPYEAEGAASCAALEAVEEIDRRLRKAWVGEVPALGKRINLEVRDQSIPDAVEAVARAAGIEARLLPGSVEDAGRITYDPTPRAAYLDLRHVTATEALDWLLVPRRMTWWVAGEEVVVGTARRGPHPSAWVYDVSAMLPPTEEERKRLKTPAAVFRTFRETADALLAAVRKTLGRDDVALWYAPGQILVFSAAESHTAVAQLFAGLADSRAKVPEDLAGLHATTSRRAKAHADAVAKATAAHWHEKILEDLEEQTWPLLADATAGIPDREAIARLRVALRRPQAADTANASYRLSLLRAAWAIAESSRALPQDRELASFAEQARGLVKQGALTAVAELAKDPDREEKYCAAAYAALLNRDDTEFVRTALALLARPGKDKEPSQPLPRAAVAALLVPHEKIGRKALAEALQKEIEDDDPVVLTALACRRAGGDLWDRFRVEQRRMTASGSLSGAVVVLLNRLCQPHLELAADR